MAYAPLVVQIHSLPLPPPPTHTPRASHSISLAPLSSRNPWNCFGVGRTGTCKLPLPWQPGNTEGSGACHGFNESVRVSLTSAVFVVESMIGGTPIVFWGVVTPSHFDAVAQI
jgi:hypothetical protein